MAALSIRSPRIKSLGISVLLLLIFLQTLLLLLYTSALIHSDEVLIGPEFFHSGKIVGPLCFYATVLLVAFALLSMLLAAYAKDRTTLKYSMVCQAASSLLTLGGIIMFLIWFHFYLSWKVMTPWFYLCVGVEVQLIITTVLTRLLGKALTSDWE